MRRIKFVLFINLLVYCNATFGAAQDIIYIDLLTQAKEDKVKATELYIDNLPLIAHYFLYTNELNNKVLDLYDELKGNYNTPTPYAQGLCQLQAYKKITILLSKGYILEFDRVDSLDCFEWAVAYIDTHLFQLLLPYSNRQMKSYLTKLLENEITAITEFKTFVERSTPRSFFEKNKKNVLYKSLGTDIKNSILNSYYVEGFDFFLRKMKGLDRIDISFILDLNIKFCESMAAEQYVKFVESASQGRLIIYETILNNCSNNLINKSEYGRAREIYEVVGISKEKIDSLEIKLESKRDKIKTWLKSKS